MNDLISRFDWNDLPEDGQAFYLFAECAAFRRVGNKVVRVSLHPSQHNLVFEDMPTKGAWYPLPPDPPTHPFKHWCSLWKPTYLNTYEHTPKNALWWGDGDARYRWYPNRQISDSLAGNLLDRQARAGTGIIGNFDKLKAAQKAAYEHFMQENWKDAV